jgi:putative ABC transport system permease protein
MEQGVEPPQFLAVRTADTSAGFAATLRNVVASVDSDQPVLVSTPMSQLVSTSIGARQFVMRLLAVFGVLSLFLSGIGLYGVVSYSVARRTSEIGVRVALGATRFGILGLVMRETAGVTAAGLGLGVLGAFASTRWVSSLLYGVTAHDPLSMAAACIAVGSVAFIAASVPARQALLVDPAAALRQE